MFIVVEGIEAGGKSTLVRGLARHLAKAGHDALVTREPGGTALGQRIRELFLGPESGLAIEPLAEAYLVNAARVQHVRDVLRPALEARRIVLCDRFTDSTLAYQGYGRGLPLDQLALLCAAAADGVTPDLTLLVDLPFEVAARRMRERGGDTDRIEAESTAFHERVRQGFLAIAASRPSIHVLDGTQPEGALLDRAWDVVSVALKTRER